MKRQELTDAVLKIGLSDAIADNFASVNGNPAILLRWNGREEYYTGNEQPEYIEWLKENFQFHF